MSDNPSSTTRLEEALRRGQAALHASEALFRQMADNLPNGFIYQIAQSVAGDRSFAFVSAGVERVFGVSPHEAQVNPLTLYGRIHEMDLPRMRAQEDLCYRENRPFD